MKFLRLYIVAAFILAFSGCAVLQDQNDAAAKPVATAFLTALDAGDAGRAYDLFSNNTKSSLTKEQVARWIQTRKVLGSVISREVILSRTTDHVGLGPDGTYQVLRYHTTYTLKKHGWEEVIVVKHADGWHVSGYHFR
jgi:hypothetical protein